MVHLKYHPIMKARRATSACLHTRWLQLAAGPRPQYLSSCAQTCRSALPVYFIPAPLLQPAAPFIDYVLEPLARRGYFASSTNPSLEVTQRMLYSPLTDCVHMTGGTATHDAIVWGSDPAEQARRRADNDPLLKVLYPSAAPRPWEPCRRGCASLGWRSPPPIPHTQ